ncbi:MAG: hypothetical protein ABJP45_00475 [Cyclobacteriaceae bacterium]
MKTDDLKALLAKITSDPTVTTNIWQSPLKRLDELIELLSKNKAFTCFDEQVHMLGTSGRSINYGELADSLLRRARETSADNAIEEVRSYVLTDNLSLEFAFLLPRIWIDSDFKFSNGVRLIRSESIQDSFFGDELLRQNMESRVGNHEVRTLLITPYQVSKYFYSNTGGGRRLENVPWPPQELLQDTRLILSLARGGDYGIPILASVVVVPKSLSFIDRSVGWGSHPEPNTQISPEIIGIEMRNADARIQQFEALSEVTKDRLRIVMKRLNDVKIDSDSVNKYINLRVCLENLFTGPLEIYGLTRKLKERIPQHSDLTEDEVGTYYSDMSTAVHNGRLPENPTTPITKIIQLIKVRIISVLENGEYPNWET